VASLPLGTISEKADRRVFASGYIRAAAGLGIRGLIHSSPFFPHGKQHPGARIGQAVFVFVLFVDSITMRFSSRRDVNSNPMLVPHVLCAEARLNSRYSERLSLRGHLPTVVFVLDQS
jgi:hypothetical protein